MSLKIYKSYAVVFEDNQATRVIRDPLSQKFGNKCEEI